VSNVYSFYVSFFLVLPLLVLTTRLESAAAAATTTTTSNTGTCYVVQNMSHLYALERVAHHGDEHVDEDDDNCDVVERKQQHPDALDDRRGRVAAREAGRVLAVALLRRVLDLEAVDGHEAEHRPEQAEQRPRQPAYPPQKRRSSVRRLPTSIRYDTIG